MTKGLKREIVKRTISIIITVIYFFSMSILTNRINNNYTLATNYLPYNAVTIDDLSDGISNLNAFPISDSEGLKTDSYVFRVTNNSPNRIKYIIGFEDVLKADIDNKLDYKYIRYSISKDNNAFESIKNMDSNGYLTTDILNGNTNNIYYLKFWIDENASNEVLNKALGFKINITQFDTTS